MNFKIPFFEKKSSISEAHFQNLGDHAYSMNDSRAFAKEGYMMNPTVFSCINYIAKNAAKITPLVRINGERVEGHDLELLLKRPNIDEGGIEFRIASYSWALLAGNCFTEKKEGMKGKFELWNWQPFNMSILNSSLNPHIPAAYVFAKDQPASRSWDVDPITGAGDMLHWRTFNPDANTPFFGMAPLKAAAASADTLNAGNKWRYNTLKNDCRPSGVLSTEAEVTEDQRKGLQADLDKKSGARNNGRTLILGGGLKWSQLSMSMKDADWLNGSKFNKQEICEVFGVPTQLVGIEGSQTYANYAEARMAVYIDTILPLVDLYFSELNRWLAPEFGENVEIYYDEESITALNPIRVEATRMKLESGALTLNEKRELLGLEPRTEPEADEVYVDPNLIPLAFDMGMGPGPEQEEEA